jgi:hypothetical protein
VSLARWLPELRAAKHRPVDYRFGVDSSRARARDTPRTTARHTAQVSTTHRAWEQDTPGGGLGEGSQCGVHHDSHAERQRALVELEVGVVQLLLRALTGPDAEAAH